MVKKHSEIQHIDKNVIAFLDGSQINLKAGERKYTDECVAESDITANPPCFRFFDGNIIVFDLNGLFSKGKNKKQFHVFQHKLWQSFSTDR
ncbi:MAG: hypothetical protein MJ172_07440 [Clostridia bacterium]|nr:hypothetical protein [Clostridia bacterium]